MAMLNNSGNVRICLFRMRRALRAGILGAVALLCVIGGGAGCGPGAANDYAGSRSCRRCHERFYGLWVTSHHGKAMQPVTPDFVASNLLPHAQAIAIGTNSYRVDVDARCVIEAGAAGTNRFRMVHALGGKNVFYFLTPIERGKLQVLPVAYDVRSRAWIDAAGSMIRHFGTGEDEALHWRDPLLTFNTACYSCHVSQLTKNYDPETDSYKTEWKEPGINCEACHGPAEKHNRAFRWKIPGIASTNLHLISWRSFTPQQKNDACSPCHAKMRPLTADFMPGQRFFDHADLSCLEDRDFYADGRDFGENYTMTGWLMNPCAQSGRLDCIHCHTSSGRYRFKTGDPNLACMPCHAAVVQDPALHTHHALPPAGPSCIDCHMPVTEFARMRRSDHSMRPPSPEATIAFGSPNACGLCHRKRDAAGLAPSVRAWHPDGRWTPKILREGALVDAARRERWEKLPEILAFLADGRSEPVVATSLVRLLARCPDARKLPALRECVRNPSPLVRAAAVEALRDDLSDPATAQLLTGALADGYRVVRVRAAQTLAPYPRDRLSPAQSNALAKAEEELLVSLRLRADEWSSHFNLANYAGDRGEAEEALRQYRAAIRLRGDVIPPYINASVAAAGLGRMEESIGFLQQAARIAPTNAAVNLNLGLALAETGERAKAEKCLRLALAEPESKAQAAYNLAVLVSERDREQAIALCRVAAGADLRVPRYARTLAFYLDQAGRTDEAIRELESAKQRHAGDAETWAMLGELQVKAGHAAEARAHFSAMSGSRELPEEARRFAGRRLQELEQESAR